MRVWRERGRVGVEERGGSDGVEAVMAWREEEVVRVWRERGSDGVEGR